MMLNKKYLNMPLGIWIILISITLFFYSIYAYFDIVTTTENGLTIWYMLIQRKPLGEFYVTQYPLLSDAYPPSYDFFIYIIFAIWNIPLFIYEQITNKSFANGFVTMWYAKAIVLPFLVLCIYEVYAITLSITDDVKKAGWSGFTFAFSVITFQAIVIMNGYDVISLFFTLCGIRAYFEEKNKQFIGWFACAIACKLFALWIFIPLVLLRWKKIWKILFIGLASMGFVIIPKVYFNLYRIISGTNNFVDGINNYVMGYIGEYLWSGEAPLAIGTIPLFFSITFIIWVICWFCKQTLTKEKVIYILLLSMSAFFLTCDTHPQWMLLLMPYIAILECISWNQLSLKLFLEVCTGVTYQLWQARRRPQCYSYNIINNMLHFEKGDREFWYTGIWTYISKLADITGVQMDYIWLLFRSILVAAFLVLLVLLRPKTSKKEEFPGDEERVFLIKSVYSMLFLLIPLLGVIQRKMGYLVESC